ncbi:Uncharacterised protein [Brucella melitensis]|nr:Uncharacterised protein [Brucella melitensis]
MFHETGFALIIRGEANEPRLRETVALGILFIDEPALFHKIAEGKRMLETADRAVYGVGRTALFLVLTHDPTHRSGI